MQTKEFSGYRSPWFWGLLGIYFLTGAVLYSPLRYQINPDAICYLTIAKDYAGGYWTDAVNAYWSPLISWILALFSWIPADPLFIFKWYNLVVGAFGLLAVERLMKYLQLTSLTRLLFLSVLAIVLLRFVFMVTTPDLTVTVLLLFFLPYWLSGQLLRKPLHTGIWLAVLYYAKAYNLFFAGVLVVFEMAQLVIRKELPVQRIILNTIFSFGVFFLLALPWLWALQQKYGYFMLAGTAKFNHGAARYDNYAYMLQFVAPGNSHAVFAWEDPVMLSGYRDYAIFGSRENMVFQLGLIWKNFRQLITGETTIMFLVFAGTILLLITWVYTALTSRLMVAAERWVFANNYGKLLLFSSVYISGYLMIFVEDRYIWTSLILSLVAAAALFEVIFTPGKRASLWIGIFLVVDLFLARHSLYNNFFKAPPHYNLIAIEEYTAARQFRSLAPADKRMAKWPDNGGYTLFASWYVAYFAESQHYFSLPAEAAKTNALITANKINIVFTEADAKVPQDLVFSNWKKIPTGIEGTIIYQRP